MSKRYQGGVLGVGFNPLQAPNAPTIGTATAATATTASVAFTAPANVGGSAITSYAVQSTPGGIGASGASSPITVSGLTTGTAYTFRVTALNSYGPSPASASSNSVTPVAQGQQAYTTAGTFSWVAPACVTSVSVVTVGGGGGYISYNCICEGIAGGGGGALAYANNISVTPGTSYAVIVGGPGFTGAGGTSSFINTSTVAAGGGTVSGVVAYQGGRGGVVVAGTGFAGGAGGTVGGAASIRSGAGGAGGYAGVGGRGANFANNGAAGAGGGGGGGAMSGCPYQGGRGGGVGILGQGSNGAGGVWNGTLCVANGGAGSSGSGQLYGGGTSSGSPAVFAGKGAVRIIWPGTTRSFPSTNTGDL
jgi:hypothetical protein